MTDTLDTLRLPRPAPAADAGPNDAAFYDLVEARFRRLVAHSPVLATYLGIHDHGQQIFTVAMLLVFIVGFAMSAGPLIWTLCAEIQPLKGRDFGIGCSTFTNWVANSLVGYSFLPLLNGIGQAETFWLYAAFNAVFIVFTFWLVPETKGVTLEQIERKLMAGLPLRRIGQ